MNLVIYRRFYDPIEANIILSKLQANGINCFLTNEHATTLLWHLSVAHGGVNIMLDKSDFDKANLILQDKPIVIDELDSEEHRCPNCNSNNTKFGSQSKQRINWIQIIFSFLLVGPAPIINKVFHCFNCGNNFELGELKKRTQ